jgi:hypothetical protein
MMALVTTAAPAQALFLVFECGEVVRLYGTCDGELTTVDPHLSLPHLRTVYDRWTGSSSTQGFYDGSLSVQGAWVGAGVIYSPAMIHCIFTQGTASCSATNGFGFCAQVCTTQGVVVGGVGHNTPPDTAQVLEVVKYRANFDACMYDVRDKSYWRVQHQTNTPNGLTCPTSSSGSPPLFIDLRDLTTGFASSTPLFDDALIEAIEAAMPMPIGTPEDVTIVPTDLGVQDLHPPASWAFVPCIDITIGFC